MLREGSPLIGLGGDLGRLLGGAGGFKEGPQSPASPFGQPSADWLKSDPDNVEQAMLQVPTTRAKSQILFAMVLQCHANPIIAQATVKGPPACEHAVILTL